MDETNQIIKHKNLVSQILILLRSRISVIFMCSWATWIACMAVGKGAPPIMPTLLAVISTALIVTSVYTYNDLVDREMDSYNSIKKNRPLAAGTVDISVAWILIYVTGVSGLFISWFINLGAFTFTVLWLTVFIL